MYLVVFYCIFIILYSILFLDFVMKRVFNWVGSKYKISSLISFYMNFDLRNYYEPFLGSGSLLLSVADKFDFCYGSDLNSEVIFVLNVLRTNYDEIKSILVKHSKNHSKAYYYYVRDTGVFTSDSDKVARFLYLNKAGFNSLYRVNKKGKFNVPFGYKETISFDYASLLYFSRNFNNVIFTNCSFSSLLNINNSVIYCDPPYFKTFSSYVSDGFYDFSFYKLLKSWASILIFKGNQVLISGDDNQHIKDLFSDLFFCYPISLKDNKNKFNNVKLIYLLISLTLL